MPTAVDRVIQRFVHALQEKFQADKQEESVSSIRLTAQVVMVQTELRAILEQCLKQEGFSIEFEGDLAGPFTSGNFIHVATENPVGSILLTILGSATGADHGKILLFQIEAFPSFKE